MVGEVFVEAEKAGFPGFGFSGRATTAPCRGEEGSRKKKCNSPDHKDSSWYYTQLEWGSKMEIPVKVERGKPLSVSVNLIVHEKSGRLAQRFFTWMPTLGQERAIRYGRPEPRLKPRLT